MSYCNSCYTPPFLETCQAMSIPRTSKRTIRRWQPNSSTHEFGPKREMEGLTYISQMPAGFRINDDLIGRITPGCTTSRFTTRSDVFCHNLKQRFDLKLLILFYSCLLKLVGAPTNAFVFAERCSLVVLTGRRLMVRYSITSYLKVY